MTPDPELRSQILELRGALQQAETTNARLLRHSKDLRKSSPTFSREAAPSEEAASPHVSQLEQRLATLEGVLARPPMGRSPRRSWGQPPAPAQAWHQSDFAPYPVMNPTPAMAGPPDLYRGPPEPANGSPGYHHRPTYPSRPAYPPEQAENPSGPFSDRSVHTEYVQVAEARAEPAANGGEGAGDDPVPPGKVSEEALRRARIEYFQECKRIRAGLLVQLDDPSADVLET